MTEEERKKELDEEYNEGYYHPGCLYVILGCLAFWALVIYLTFKK